MMGCPTIIHALRDAAHLSVVNLSVTLNGFHGKGKIQHVQLKLDLRAEKSYFLCGELCGHVIGRTNKYYCRLHHNYVQEFLLFRNFSNNALWTVEWLTKTTCEEMTMLFCKCKWL